jgi:hypothetical protein
MSWIKFLLSVLGAWFKFKSEKDEVEKTRREHEEAVAAKEQAEKTILEKMNKIERKDLDSSENSEDPMGVDNWNSKR